MTRYDFGPSHPMNPVRLDLTMRLARALGVLDHVELTAPTAATVAELLRVHTPDFLAAVQQCSAPDSEGDLAHGIGTPDVPTFTDMHEVTSLIAGATLGAATAVWRGDVAHAFSPAGGLHHAMPDAAAGFCVYNDISVAIAGLLDGGAERVAYVDVDVHHGDGVEAAFWDDPRVLTISIHEDPRTLYPGTGRPFEIGGPAAEGMAVNVACRPGPEDAGWLRAIHSVVPHLLEVFAPAGSGDSAWLRHPSSRPARAPGTDHRRAADGRRVAAPVGARVRRRPMGGDRRWRLRHRRRRPADLDAGDGRDGRTPAPAADAGAGGVARRTRPQRTGVRAT